MVPDLVKKFQAFMDPVDSRKFNIETYIDDINCSVSLHLDT